MACTTPRRLLSSATKDFALRLLNSADLQAVIYASLDATQRWHLRDCPLKAPLVVWFVLLLALDRSVSIGDLLSGVIDLLRERVRGLRLKDVCDQAIMHARARLGVAPLKAVFHALALSITPAATICGLRPWVVDGVHATTQDTPANDERFGRPKVARGRAGFPQIAGVALVDATTRRVKDVVWGRCTISEREACEKLLAHLGPGDLLLKDRGFAAVWLFAACRQRRVNFLCRLPLSWKPLKIKSLGRGEYLAVIRARIPIPEDERVGRRKTRDESMVVRVIEYRIGKNERVRLVTDLLDPVQFPALELAEAYHVRWEVELAFDEIKVHLATVCHGTLHTTFRSRTPDGVLQEAYGLLVAYNLLRELMLEAGRRHDVKPLEISFLQTLRVVRRAIPRFEAAPPGALTSLWDQLLRDIADCRIDRPRRPRTYDRVVKVKMSKWKVKRPCHRQRPGSATAGLQLVRRYSRREGGR